MKKLLLLLMLVVTFQMSAQDQSTWLTDNATALKLSEKQNKPILVFVTNNQKTEASEALKESFFNINTFEKLSAKSILLKLDVSDKNSTNARLGIHYTKRNGAPGIALIDSHGKTIANSLSADASKEDIRKFIAIWNESL